VCSTERLPAGGARLRRHRLVATVGLWLATTSGALAPAATPPNILFLLVDAQRADHVSSYGYPRATTPTLDALAARGVRLTTAMAPSNRTGTSMPSIWTGLLPSRHANFRRGDVLDEGFTTVAELLRARGYRTAAWCPNPSLDGRFRIGQGFDLYRSGNPGWKATREWRRWETAKFINKRALQWLDRDRDRPFFAWLHYRDVHAPYAPPPPFDRKFAGAAETMLPWLSARITPADRGRADAALAHLVARYDGDVRYTDHQIAQLLAALERRGLLERTVVVVTADHGDAFLEHGQLGHDQTLYEEELHVPLIVVRPGEIPRVVDDLVSTMDLFPTLLELAGVPAPASDAVSLVPLLDGRTVPRHRDHAFAESRMRIWGWGGRQRAIREGDWKLIVYDWYWWPFDDVELFDLRADPHEHRDLAGREPQRVRALRATLDGAIARAAAGARRADSAPLDPQLRQRLEAIGYAD
jgi:arylsulfatase A-like enzyme